MALAAAVFALVLLGALVTAAFYAGHLEQRAARGGADAAHALEAAEAGLALVMGEWATFPQLGSLAVGDSVALPASALGGRVAFSPTVLRLTDVLYLIRSEGTRLDADGRVRARRAIAMVGRTDGAALVPLRQRAWVQVY
jgi:hypothetical protein